MIRRPLDRYELAEEFLVNVLQKLNCAETTSLAITITHQEIVNREQLRENTLVSPRNRVRTYASNDAREILRTRIIEELFTLRRPDRDSDITLGNGGSLPKTGDLSCARQAFLLLGPPASGKSRIANALAEQHRALILDSDHAKQKLPEYHAGQGAALVHEESDAIIFGHRTTDVKPLIAKAIGVGANIILPKVGANKTKLVALARELRKHRYQVSLVLVSIGRELATSRCLDRFENSGRYVPLTYVFDEIANEPQLSYYRLRTQKKFRKLWRYHAAYSTDAIASGQPPELLCKSKEWPDIDFTN